MEPLFTEVFNLPAEKFQPVSAQRAEVITAKKAWQKDRLLANLTCAFLVVVVIAAIVGWNVYVGILMLVLCVAFQGVVVWRESRSKEIYLDQAATLGKSCQIYDAVVVAIRLDFSDGRYFVAIILRDRYYSDIYDYDSGAILYERLQRLGVASSFFPKLLSGVAPTKRAGLSMWQTLISDASDLGFNVDRCRYSYEKVLDW